MLNFLRIFLILPFSVDVVDYFEKGIEFSVFCVEVRSYSYQIAFFIQSFPEVNFEIKVLNLSLLSKIT